MWSWVYTNVIGPGSQWFWAMVSFFAVAIGLGLIYHQIRLQRQANFLHTLGEMDKRWNSKELLSARKQACSNYLSDQPRIKAEEGQILSFFEDVGVYLERKVFDDEAVWDNYSYYIEHYWAMYLPHINEFRAETKDNTLYEKFQSLNQAMHDFSSKKGVATNPKSQDEINKFIRGEVGTNVQHGAQADS